MHLWDAQVSDADSPGIIRQIVESLSKKHRETGPDHRGHVTRNLGSGE